MPSFAEGLATGLSGLADDLQRNRALKASQANADRAFGLQERQFQFNQEKFGAEQSLEQQKLKAAQQKQLIDRARTIGDEGLKTSLASVNAAPDQETRQRVFDRLNQKGPDGFSPLEKMAFNRAGGDRTKAQAMVPNMLATLQAAVESAPTKQELLSQKSEEQKATLTGKLEGAVEVARSLQNVAPELQEDVRKSLNLDQPQASEFFTALNEVEKLREAGDTTSERFKALQSFINKKTEKSGFTFEATPDGGVRVKFGGGAVPKDASPQLLDKLRSQKDSLDPSIQIVDSLLTQLNENPNIFAVPGTARSLADTAQGILSDTARALNINFPALSERLGKLVDLEGLEKGEADAFKPSGVGELAVFEKVLAFGVAKTLQPDGKLLKDTIDTAKDIANLTGLTTSDQVKDRLQTIGALLKAQQSQIQRRLEQSVSGEAATPKESPVRERVPAEEGSDLDALKKRVEEILGTK